jgi:hypothetical protein
VRKVIRNIEFGRKTATNSSPLASDEVFEEALDKANRLEDAIVEKAAEGIAGLAGRG